MDEGVVVGRSPGVKCRDNRDMLGDLGAVLLTSRLFHHSVAAMRCSSCGTVVIPGNSTGATQTRMRVAALRDVLGAGGHERSQGVVTWPRSATEFLISGSSEGLGGGSFVHGEAGAGSVGSIPKRRFPWR